MYVLKAKGVTGHRLEGQGPSPRWDTCPLSLRPVTRVRNDDDSSSDDDDDDGRVPCTYMYIHKYFVRLCFSNTIFLIADMARISFHRSIVVYLFQVN
jgi:hypothetical protein